VIWFGNFSTKAQYQEHFNSIEPIDSYETSKTGPDLESDSSYQKFLDEKYPFQDTNYEPSDLVAIPSDFTFNAARKFQLRQEA
jgi:hypothetical protein